MAKRLTRISRVLVVGRVFSGACGLLLAVAVAGCEGPAQHSGVPDRDFGMRTSDGADGRLDTTEAEPRAGPDADAEPRQLSPPASAAEASAAVPSSSAPSRDNAVSGAPPGSPGAGVRDTAPAAGPPRDAAATPVLAPAPPEKPAIDDDPERLMGLGTAELTRLLGNPRFVRRDSSAQLWRYRNKTCILDLFLYRDAGRSGYLVSHVETRHREGGAAPKRECFGALLLDRLDREAG